MKQTLLVMGSILALMVVGWEIHLLVAYAGPYTFILSGRPCQRSSSLVWDFSSWPAVA
ncbi:hypothetical protein [Bradyrhizobium sp. CCGE-LA001]|uniref:hypothetical protein n=1 Tax=Bradyrhizobium sp. CCGE-LA001 TaxID=1223566 RepID=UPI0013149BBC|nr:hypothetical protein [Bradyrhizobium sp. CCGE-LA001]